MDDREEALWLTFLVAYLSPLEDTDDAFAAIAEVHTSWASGELPELGDALLGPRTAHAPGRGPDTLLAYRSRAEKAGGQSVLFTGEAALTPARRFERGFERLSLPRLHRAARYEFLLLAGGLGLLDVRSSSLLFGVEAMDGATLAAKRVFGIGDAINLQRRATELLAASEITPGALDLALVNWARPADDRITAGSHVVADPAATARVEAALGISSIAD
jgi:hypothetical protein